MLAYLRVELTVNPETLLVLREIPHSRLAEFFQCHFWFTHRVLPETGTFLQAKPKYCYTKRSPHPNTACASEA